MKHRTNISLLPGRAFQTRRPPLNFFLIQKKCECGAGDEFELTFSRLWTPPAGIVIQVRSLLVFAPENSSPAHKAKVKKKEKPHKNRGPKKLLWYGVFSVSIEAQVHLLLLSLTKLNTLGLLRHLYSNFCFASGGLSICYLCAVTLSQEAYTRRGSRSLVCSNSFY